MFPTETDFKLPAYERLVYPHISSQSGISRNVRMDNGSEYISLTIDEWEPVSMEIIKSGSQICKAFIENSTGYTSHIYYISVCLGP